MDEKQFKKSLLNRVTAVFALSLAGTIAMTAAPARADYDDGIKAYAAQNYESAVDTWRRHAIAGDVKSKTILGDVYSGKTLEVGEGLTSPEKTGVIPQDDVEALAWYILAANHDFDSYNQNPSAREVNAKYQAQERIPVMKNRMSTTSVKKAQKRVVEILSAETDFDLYRLGLMYQAGAGLPKDNVEALKFYELAKGRNHNSNSLASEAAGYLVNMMSKKDVANAQERAANWEPPLPEALRDKTPRQLELEAEIKRLKSIQLAESLANIEDEFSDNEDLLQSALAALGFYGGPIDGSMGRESRIAVRSFQYSLVQGKKGMSEEEKRDTQTGLLTPEQKVELIKRAAKREHPQSMYVYGLMYAEGIGVPVNGKTAVKWLKKSAGYGYALAHYALGVVYRDGIIGEDPINPNVTEAVFYLGQANALGVRAAGPELVKLRYEMAPATNERGSHEK
ncbi:MAG: peptidoglycan-binding protein [bacterium]